MKRYNPKDIEPRWQKAWADNKIYETTNISDRPKKYILEYFPYPSGSAMHVGHVRNYAIGDTLARYYRMQGFNVLHAMGWDAFGLPAENYAIKNGISPKQAIAENTSKFKRQLTQMGFSYDWSREINSSDPSYYRWTQWFFLLLHKRGLAYQKDSLQWWCPVDKTVLANEQVEAGLCWRCGSRVEKKALKQWFFKITDYADRLEKDLDDVDWSHALKTMQRNWIGRSKGAEVSFSVADSDEALTVFTTRPDTLYGATFMVIAPEHPLVQSITTTEHQQAVDDYVKAAQAKSDIERQETDREKTGVFTGAYAINPINDEKIPIWVADYVLAGYGTGAIMAVPAHDQRDWGFAKKFDLPIRQVVAPETGETREDETYADGGCSVVFDPTQQKYAFGKLGNGKLVFFAGGMNKGEELEAAILRELAEESGLTDIKHTEHIGVAYGHYRNQLKQVNRRAKADCLLVILNSAKAVAQKLEAHEDHQVVWLDAKEVLDAWQAHDGGDYDHYIIFLKQAVGRAIELGIDKTSDPAVFTQGALSGEGIMVNSGPYDGMPASETRDKIVADLESSGKGKERTNYRIRDWLISRQRYWGAPIPMVHCDACGIVPVPEDQLPVELPELTSFEPSGDGRSPLARVEDWVTTTCPQCDGPAQRETDTMDGFACSSWYFLRFLDPHNDTQPADPAKVKYWMPVDDYIGGAEHAVMHLLYVRFWFKVMQDEGLIDFNEPIKKLRNHGMILAPDGQKMSKSKGNTIEPGGLIDQGYGADAVRIMELFIGPWNQAANWSVEGMGGCFRFLQRVWTVAQEYVATDSEIKQQESSAASQQLLQVTHKTVKRVTEDLQDMGFNTAIAALMEFTNELYKIKASQGFKAGKDWQFALTTLVQLLAPFAPHITEELWQDLGQAGMVHTTEWPKWDESLLASDTMTIVVQVNGKVRATISVPTEATKEAILAAAQADAKVAAHITDKPIKKSIYIPGKLVNLVIG